MSTVTILRRIRLLAIALLCSLTAPAYATASIAEIPLFFPGNVPPLNLLVMGRDHKLYYEAYNDASDLTGDGVPDVGYKPDSIDYFGLFDSYKCYGYDTDRFVPQYDTPNKKCSGHWSGDFLNYLTTSRIDALRKVLYGGSRHVDTASSTNLQRSHIPQDAHSWGKEYAGINQDGYDIRDYTPADIGLPDFGRRHLFANTTLLNDGDQRPLLRLLKNRANRIWEWVSIERPVSGNQVEANGTRTTVSPTDFVVRVEVCKTGANLTRESNCKLYGVNSWKPVGLLQDFGENDSMLFGLLTGSYTKNTSGGVLRRNISSIKEEIDSETGIFKTDPVGIIQSIDRFRTVGFGGTYQYNENCGWIVSGPISEGQCRMWGNPVAEMTYEGLRYFMGKGTPTSQFSIAAGTGDDGTLGLPVATWQKPLEQNPWCSPAVQVVISDVNPSYDTQYVPGSYFSSFSGDVSGLNAASLGDAIWANEYGGSSVHYVGQSGAVNDGAPTPKTVTGFGSIRGLAPEEPTKLGGYYSASVAYFARTNNLLSDPVKKNFMSTYVVALASPLPRIEIPVAGQLVTLVPFAKSVNGFGINPLPTSFQPVNQIVDFYIETIVNTSASNSDLSINSGRPFGRFRINYEDVEQGADHDMDAIVIYEFRVTEDNRVQIDLISEYAAGSIEQHMGYVISGTTQDGIYLEVRDCDTANSNGTDPTRHSSVSATMCRGNNPSTVTRYFLSTPPGTLPGDCALTTGKPAACDTALPLSASRQFTPGTTDTATLLRDPLWYAAKYGGFDTTDGNTMPTQQEHWDKKGDGNPDNYFLVTNALTLKDQLTEAFNQIMKTTSSASSVATNSTRLDTDTLIYQARFRSDDWTGQLLALGINPDGTIGTTQWDAAQLIAQPADRKIFTRREGQGVTFQWHNLSDAQKGLLSSPPLTDAQEAILGIPPSPGLSAEQLGQIRLEWLRGSMQHAQDDKGQGGIFRYRSAPLGDIINSDPFYVAVQNFGYDALPEGTPGKDTYVDFRIANTNRPGVLYVGANDGKLHGFDAESGEELFAYIPESIFHKLSDLTSPDYAHKYYVDGSPYVGEAYFDGQWRTILVGTTGAGAKSVFALDVTDPDNFGSSNVLWEFTDIDLGYTIGQPKLARLNNGQWVAIFGNGYGSSTNRAVLYVVDLESGYLLRKLDTGSEGTGTVTNPGGLSTPSLLDVDGDRTIDMVYAGDLLGNLWKFDFSSTTAANWDIAFRTDPGSVAQPLFTARNAAGQIQPISAPLEIGRNPNGGYMIYFGSGKYFEVNDNVVLNNPPIQSFYGIWDDGSRITVIDRSSNSFRLVQQQIIAELTQSGFDWRVVTQNAVSYTGGNARRGWYIDLVSPVLGAQGERVVAKPILRLGRVIFPTLVPSSDPCEFGGYSWLMEMDALSGGRLAYSVFDLNQDGYFDESDFVEVLIDGQWVMVPVSGRRTLEGIIKTPAVISAGTIEYKYAGGSAGGVEMIVEKGGAPFGRRGWRELR